MSRKVWLTAAAAMVCWFAQAVPATAEEGVTDDTIRIGVFAPLSGSATLFGKGLIGVEAYYRDVNAHGGINGRKIEIVREDDGCDPAKGIAAIKKLIGQDHVFMIHGGMCSGVVLAGLPEIVRAGIPYMDIAAAASGISNPYHANVFQPLPNTGVVGQTMVDFAMTKPNAQKIAIVSHSDEWGKSNHDPAVARLKEKYNLAPIADLTLERGDTDATPQILKLRNSGADVILLMLYPAETAIFVRDAYKYGVRTAILCSQGTSLAEIEDRVGNPAAVANVYTFSALAGALDGPEMEKWRALLKQYFPDQRPEEAVFNGIGGAAAVVNALKLAGRDLTRAHVLEQLNKTTDFHTGVLSVPITFTNTDHAGVKSGGMMTLIDGKTALVASWPAKK
jgi:branched-chain amino acid transport system substrate-binding protein